MLRYLVSLQTSVSGLVNRDDRGATAVEYGLLVALIAAIIVVAVAALGQKLLGIFDGVTTAI